MVEDKYARSLINNIYYDTPDFLLIRRSIAKPVYKEKLRVRSYGVPGKDDKVFVEIKKKYKKVVADDCASIAGPFGAGYQGLGI